MSAATRRPWRQCAGHTLLEALLVIVVIGVLASIALPSLTVANADHLDSAASEVAGALRYARSRSLLTGTPHGVQFDLSPTARARVFRLDELKIFDVVHPVTRQPYEVPLAASRGSASFKLDALEVNFVGEPPGDSSIIFDLTGAPVKPVAAGNAALLVGRVGISSGRAALKVTLAPHTGRVTVR